MQNDQKEPVVPSDPPPAIESNFAFHQRLRQTPQYAEAEREASAVEPSEGRMSTVHDYSPRGVKADPGKAAKKIERLRELLAWFVMRYQIKKEAAIPQAPPAIEAVIAAGRSPAGTREEKG